MTLNTFFFLLIPHVLGDVVFTSYRLAVLKRSQRISDQLLAISFHSSVHAFFAGLILLVLGKLWLKGAVLVFSLHFAIDFLRCRAEMKLFGSGRIHVKRSELFAWVSGSGGNPEKMSVRKLWPWLLIHVLDQTAHVGSLYWIASVV